MRYTFNCLLRRGNIKIALKASCYLNIILWRGQRIGRTFCIWECRYNITTMLAGVSYSKVSVLVLSKQILIA